MTTKNNTNSGIFTAQDNYYGNSNSDNSLFTTDDDRTRGSYFSTVATTAATTTAPPLTNEDRSDFDPSGYFDAAARPVTAASNQSSFSSSLDAFEEDLDPEIQAYIDFMDDDEQQTTGFLNKKEVDEHREG